jgi:O-antigen/teichoic acid export membrane protein
MTSLKKNIIANYIGRAWPALLAIILIPVYIDFLGIEAYGLVGFFTTLSAAMGVLDLGIGATMNRELARRSAVKERQKTQRDLVRTLEIIYWTIAIVAGVIVVFSASFIANSWVKAENLDSFTILRSIQYMAISVALRFPISLYQGGLMGLQKQVLANKILIILGTLRGLGAVLILWGISATIEAFFIWQIIISLIGSIVFLFALWSSLPSRNKKRAKFEVGILKEIWRYAAAVSANAFIGMFLTQLDKIILSTMLPLKMFAYYTIASTVASSIWMIILPYNNAVFPHLVQLIEMKKENALVFFFHKSSQILSLLLIPISAMLIFFSEDILLLWLQDAETVKHTYILVSMLVFGTMLNGITSIPAYSSMAYGWPMLITYTNVIQSIVIIPLIIFLTINYEGKGAALAWIILNSSYILFMVPVFFKKHLIKERNSWYIKDIIFPMIIAFVFCAGCKFLLPKAETLITNLILLFSVGLFAILITSLSLDKIRGLMLFQYKKLRLKT